MNVLYYKDLIQSVTFQIFPAKKFLFNKFCCLLELVFLFRPLLRGGGGGTIYSNGFFQTILAKRYIYRTELRLVSLEMLSSVEYGIKSWDDFQFVRGFIEATFEKIERIPLILFTFSGIFD